MVIRLNGRPPKVAPLMAICFEGMQPKGDTRWHWN